MVKKKRNKINVKLILALVFIAAVFLRTYGLSENLFFGPEQGMDFFRIKEIAVDHQAVLVGPKTDIAGIFHGPIYFYVSVIPFLLSRGDPVFTAYFLIILNSLTVFIIFALGRELFNKSVGLISSLLFTVSFGAVSFSRWLSSPPLTIPLSALFFLSLVNFLQGRKKWLYLASITLGLLCQPEFLNYAFFLPIAVVIIVIFFKEFRRCGSAFLLVNIVLFLIFGFSHYVIFDLKNSFIMSKNIFNLALTPEYKLTVLETGMQIYNVLSVIIAKNFLIFSELMSDILIITSIVLLLKSKYSIAKKLILPWVLIPIVILLILRHSIDEQFFVYFIVCIVLLVSFLVYKLISWRRSIGVLFLVLLIITQINAWRSYIPRDLNMFYQSTQPDLKISDEKKIIDSIYSRQKGKPFSFQSYTIPYWTQHAWEYLFWQYGRVKYGYEPVNNGKTLYVIIQDDPSHDWYQKYWLKGTVSKWGEQKDSFRHGIFTVRVLSIP